MFRIPVKASCSLILAAALTPLARPLAGQQKPVMAPADYGRFETIGGDAISPDGKWYAYRLTKVEQDGELRIRRTDSDEPAKVVPLALQPTFSRDSRFLAWLTDVSLKERERLTAQKKPVQQGLTYLALGSDLRHSFDAVRAFGFSSDGKYLALHGYVPEGSTGGAALQIVNLTTGSVIMSFQDIGEYRWLDTGGKILMTIATGTPNANGLQLFDPATGMSRLLENSSSSYTTLLSRRGSTDVLVTRSNGAAGTSSSSGSSLILWRSLATEPTRTVLDSSHASLKGELFSATQWSPDGKAILLTVRPKANADSAPQGGRGGRGGGGPGAAATGPADSSSTVQIWHTKDVQLFPAQSRGGAGATNNRASRAIWTPADNRIVKIENVGTTTPTLLDGWTHAVDKPSDKYDWGTKFGRRYNDVYLLDVASGKRSMVLEKVRYSYESPEGHYLLNFDGKDFWSYDVSSGKKTNITAAAKAIFTNTDSDTPTDLLPPYGIAGWVTGEKGVLLYDKYDVWRVALDGSSQEKLTSGRGDQVVHRLVRLDVTTPGIDLTKPVYFSITGDRDRKSGYARRNANGSMERLVFLDKAVAGLRRADSSDVFLYRAEDRADSPDIFTVGHDFKSPRQLTSTNPFLNEIAWTREELISFKSEGGIPLKGVLLYPVNYDPARKYPMIVYTYEILSNTLHSFTAPSERSYYNQTVWTMNGYFVFMPDIIFKPREPGISTIESVRAGVKAVAARGLIDPKRVGHIGHSWGGYEAAFLGTHGGDFLATTVAGASITDLVSFMGQIHWGGGSAEADHSETGQARMEVPYWEDPAAHRRNSALENVQNMTIPMLMAHGNKDGTVEFFQATEFWNFARRAGKDVVLLVYDGEDHGFSRKSNQIDYQRRILEWFGHYLKSEPAPKWITDGIKAGDVQAEIKRVAEKKGP